MVDDRPDEPDLHSKPDRPSQGKPDFSDSSWPIFFMYSKVIEEEDNQIIEAAQKDGDGILIFGSPRIAMSVF